MEHIDPLKDLSDYAAAELASARIKVVFHAEIIRRPLSQLFTLRLMLVIYKNSFGFQRFLVASYWCAMSKFIWIWISHKLRKWDDK